MSTLYKENIKAKIEEECENLGRIGIGSRQVKAVIEVLVEELDELQERIERLETFLVIK